MPQNRVFEDEQAYQLIKLHIVEHYSSYELVGYAKTMWDIVIDARSIRGMLTGKTYKHIDRSTIERPVLSPLVESIIKRLKHKLNAVEAAKSRFKNKLDEKDAELEEMTHRFNHPDESGPKVLDFPDKQSGELSVDNIASRRW